MDGRVTFGVSASPFFLTGYGYLEAREPGASILICADTKINNNFIAIAEYGCIKIGSRCLIGMNVEILGSDFHGLKVEDRNRSEPSNSGDVVIGDDVFIGANVKILKGVHIGEGTVIANGAVVTKSIPSGVIAAGNPARVVRPL